MTKEDFIKNCIDGDFEIPNIGHYRVEKTDKGFISYNEMNQKDTLKKYSTFEELYNSEINGKKFFEWVNSFHDIYVIIDKDIDSKTILNKGDFLFR